MVERRGCDMEQIAPAVIVVAGWLLGVSLLFLWAWAALRALMRGQMIWLVIIIFLGPLGALAYLAGSLAGERTRAIYGLGSTPWQPPRRR